MASHISRWTSEDTRDPTRSSFAGLKGGNPNSERVGGTYTCSRVICDVAAWCFAWLYRHVKNGTLILREYTYEYDRTIRVKRMDLRGVEDEADHVVDPLALRERVVPALMADAPQSEAEQARYEGAYGPRYKARQGI